MADSKLQSLTEIFNNKFFRIPDYQRGYAWQTEHLDDFWEDIESLNPNRVHYTGLLTVEPLEKSQVENIEKWQDDLWLLNKGLKAYYIIDGQQRLTTTIILINTILNKYKNEDGINFQTKSYWVDKFLYQQFSNFKSFLFGYEKDNPSDEYFKTKILDQTSFASSTVAEQTIYTMNLQAANDFFKKKIAKLKKDEIEIIFRKVTNQLKFNLYEIDDELDVSVTFETMNNRGKPLTTIELLKNRLMYLTTLFGDEIPTTDKLQLRKGINEAWKTVYEYLGKNKDNILDDDSFLIDHWIMYFKYDRSIGINEFLLKNTFSVKNVLNAKINFTEILVFVESIQKSIREWFYIYNPQYCKYNQEVKNWISKLLRIRSGNFDPIILAALVHQIEEKKLIELMQVAERFTFTVYYLTGRQSNTAQSELYRKANELFKTPSKIDEVIQLITHYNDGTEEHYGWYSLENFQLEIKDLFERNREGFYAWKGIKYVLYEYELHLQNQSRGEEKVKWEDVNNESIEHIYPREATNDCWKSNFNMYTPKQRKILLNSLGNLLLLSSSKNSEWQNECFDFKKEHADKKKNQVGFFNGSYSEIEVSRHRDWTPKTILDRSLKIASFIEQRWKVNLGSRKEKIELLQLSFLEK